jgi:tetratricopeptide (TPR) repeat protein
MIIAIKENTIEEIQKKLITMNTDLNKLSYIEIALKEPDFSFEIKRHLWNIAAKLYEERKMYEKAAKAMSHKGTMDITQNERIESYLKTAELYAKIGKVESADDAFMRAGRESDTNQKAKINLAKKNIYILFAKELEIAGKKAAAMKFYEKLIKMQIDPIEKKLIKQKLLQTYKALAMFREAKLLEGMI